LSPLLSLLAIHLPPASTLFPYTTLFRSNVARVVGEALRRDFGVAAPRIALCGLNPHAGESGSIGREEIEIINPAAAALRAEGWRSEEHTSELQSRENLVCRLLLEKKNKK